MHLAITGGTATFATATGDTAMGFTEIGATLIARTGMGGTVILKFHVKIDIKISSFQQTRYWRHINWCDSLIRNDESWRKDWCS